MRMANRCHVSLLILLLWCRRVTCNHYAHDVKIQSHRQHHLLEYADSWYKRYDAYPAYCSTPDEMKTRAVPPLSSSATATLATGATRLRHVTVVARHGARTPYKAGLNCWEDYNINPETAVWNCSFNAYLATPPQSEIAILEQGRDRHAAVDTSAAMFLFEKRYDALKAPLSNYFGGTCQLGQLQGYQQELTNGQILRDAYLSRREGDHDPRMRLIEIVPNSYQDVEKQTAWDHVHYRVDDGIRTLLSGQVILRGLLEPELQVYVAKHGTYPVLPMYTADYSRDVLDANEGLCPRLADIRHRNEASQAFQEYNKSDEAMLLRRFQREVLKVPDPNSYMNAIDCLMTTMCTDRPLPDAVNDFTPEPANNASAPMKTKWSSEYGTNMLQRLYEFNAHLTLINAKANESEYSKLAMSFLWREIMTKINEHRHNSSFSSTNGSTTPTLPKRLTLISGHDSTIIPLLATLGIWNDSAWPTYACMMIIELHELDVVESETTPTSTRSRKIYPSNYAFRLIYNGAVLTSQIKGCPNYLELCDVSVLDKHIVLDGDCKREESNSFRTENNDAITREILSTKQGIFFLLGVVISSALMGAIIVFLALKGCGKSRSRDHLYHPEPLEDTRPSSFEDSQLGDDPTVS